MSTVNDYRLRSRDDTYFRVNRRFLAVSLGPYLTEDEIMRRGGGPCRS